MSPTSSLSDLAESLEDHPQVVDAGVDDATDRADNDPLEEPCAVILFKESVRGTWEFSRLFQKFGVRIADTRLDEGSRLIVRLVPVRRVAQ